MQEEKITYAKEYKAPDFLIDHTRLTFELEEGVTRVTSQLRLRRADDSSSTSLVLDGQDLVLVSIKIDDRLIQRDEFVISDDKLTIHHLPNQPFQLECVTEIYPEKNLSLEGLYRSRSMYCTQCEAEGFRRITYYLDRPDVLSEFETTLIADSDKFPVMLSNGNCIEDKVVDGKRLVTWHDPFKKPCYLFALVAGELEVVEDSFVSQSGRDIKLQIFVEAKDLDKCDHAMNALKAAMKWDEEVYGREYDLDIFMIVAVDDFNMGAMENKGLNIFNTSCVLANPKTTTDAGFQRVEAVVAHEYFHNWSGNRVTCRDWFQLSLKEGFTVYRDSEFSADMNSRSVKRIDDATLMRTAQFAEDSGPMAHPIRPDSYIEISNFYTLTIYEKGAEVVRMMANLLGPDKFRAATDLYFNRFDGQAVICEDFVCCMEEASGLDLKQFRLWYSQAGTPELAVTSDYDAKKRQYTIKVAQFIPDTAGQTDKLPMFIPFKLALFGKKEPLALKLPTQEVAADELTLTVTDTTETFVFEGVDEMPVPSLLRSFSAPVKVHYDYTDDDLSHLIQVDNDGFSRFNAAQQLYVNVLSQLINDEKANVSLVIHSLKTLLTDDIHDPAILAKLLMLPSDPYLVSLFDEANPQAIFKAKKKLQSLIADQLSAEFENVYRAMASKPKDLSADAIAARSLKNTILNYLAMDQNDIFASLCQAQLNQADNMTDQSSALKAIVHYNQNKAVRDDVLLGFYQQWKDEALVVNMWLQIQATSPRLDTLDHVKHLTQHESYQSTNPNKIRSLVGAFCSGNLSQFHAVSGEGYAFLTDQVITLDALNPQIASRLITPLTQWRKFESNYSQLMKAELERLKGHQLSKDLFEVVSKSLK